MSILGDALRLYLAAQRIDQKTAAKAIGISETTLCRMLNDDRMPDAAGFARLMVWMTATPASKSAAQSAEDLRGVVLGGGSAQAGDEGGGNG